MGDLLINVDWPLCKLKDKLNIIKVLLYKEITNSYISHNVFVSVNIVVKEYD